MTSLMLSPHAIAVLAVGEAPLHPSAQTQNMVWVLPSRENGLSLFTIHGHSTITKQ